MGFSWATGAAGAGAGAAAAGAVAAAGIVDDVVLSALADAGADVGVGAPAAGAFGRPRGWPREPFCCF